MIAAIIGRNPNGLDGADKALRIVVTKAAKIGRKACIGACSPERTDSRRDYANGSKLRIMLIRFG